MTRLISCGVLVSGLWMAACGAPTAPAPLSASSPSGVATGPSQASLAVVSMSVVEFQDVPGGQWYYAPLVRVAETSGRSSAEVISMSFSIPGLGHAPGLTTSKCVEPGQELDLLREIYGDYEITIFQPGVRASAGQASGVLTFSDDAGRIGVVTASGPVIPGGPSTTYTGGSRTWPCGQR